MREIPQVTYYELWYQDLEKIATEAYGLEDYSLLQRLDYSEFKNDMYDVWNTEDGLEYMDEAELEEILEDGIENLHPRAMHSVLAKDGHIPAGKYLIHIWW